MKDKKQQQSVQLQSKRDKNQQIPSQQFSSLSFCLYFRLIITEIKELNTFSTTGREKNWIDSLKVKFVPKV